MKNNDIFSLMGLIKSFGQRYIREYCKIGICKAIDLE